MPSILLIASAVGALGDGVTGGVSDVVLNTAKELCRRGYRIDILASSRSTYNGPARLIGIEGKYQETLANAEQNTYTAPPVTNSLLANYWQYAQEHQQEYDLIFNLCHDWLPFSLTASFQTPVIHQVNLADENAIITKAIQEVVQIFPHRVGVLSISQAKALGIEKKVFLCGQGIDLETYPFQPQPQSGILVWSARISPEKGLQDAAAIAARSRKKLIVCGFMQNRDYFTSVDAQYYNIIEYYGFLDKSSLVKTLGEAEALLCTHQWIEAFGLSVIEALACGTPVITYDRGGPAELIQNGKNGFVVPVDDVGAAAEAVGKIESIERVNCRKSCEEKYSLKAYGDRLEAWFKLLRISEQ